MLSEIVSHQYFVHWLVTPMLLMVYNIFLCNIYILLVAVAFGSGVKGPNNLSTASYFISPLLGPMLQLVRTQLYKIFIVFQTPNQINLQKNLPTTGLLNYYQISFQMCLFCGNVHVFVKILLWSSLLLWFLFGMLFLFNYYGVFIILQKTQYSASRKRRYGAFRREFRKVVRRILVPP